MTGTYYVCGHRRNVRGTCGHKHKTLHGAVDCLRKDQRNCRRQGGYSDRGIHPYEDGKPRSLNEWEIALLDNTL